MKKFTLLFCVVLAGYSFSQDFTAAAEQTQGIDEHGNVINNDVDKQGFKQGDWFYLDINGNQVAKKTFVDDKCKNTYVRIADKWESTKVLTKKVDLQKDAKAKLNAKGVTLNNDRQVLVILGKSGELLTANLLGKWSQDEEAKVLAILKNHFKDLNISASSKMYILL